MAKRTLAPALLRRSSIDPRMAEYKTLTVMGPGIIPSTIALGQSSVNRAAGWNLDEVIADAYERSVWVFKSVELYAKHAGRLPILGEYDDETVESHPLLRVLNKQANPLETGRAFKMRLASLLLLSKVGVFVEVTYSRAGVVTRLDLLPPDRVRIIPDPHGDYIDYFEFTRPDGEIRNLPTSRVLWIREPHPTDPFCGVTPLEAAGVSIELDHLARTYNTSFIRRDSRPGGILGVDTDQIDERELERIEKVFQPGAHHAGKITAIGTGPGGMTYIDTSARPRDMAYEHTSEKAKAEVLAAFGLPESLIGNTAGRTYDNASQDEENWARFHLLPFLELITDAFQRLADGDMELKYDTSSIEALELPKKRARAEAREEWNMGLRSAKEYRELRPELDEIDNAHTRALWFAPSKAPVPAKPEDAAELGMDTGQGGGEGGPMPPGGMPPAPPAGDGGAQDLAAEDQLLDQAGAAQAGAPAPAPQDAAPQDVVPPGMVFPPADAGAPAPAPAATAVATDPATEAATGPATDAVTSAAPAEPTPGDASNLLADTPGTSAATGVVDDPMTDTGVDNADLAGEDPLAKITDDKLEGKSLQAGLETKSLEESTYSPSQDELQRAELAIKAALDALTARQLGVVKARLDSPKTRRGTRFWTPESEADDRAGDAPVDTERVLAADRWVREVSDTLSPIVQPAAADASSGLLTAMAAGGALVGMTGAVAQVAGRTVEPPAMTSEQIAQASGQAAVLPSLAAIALAETAMRKWLEDMATAINKHLVATQPSMDELQAWLDKEWATQARELSNSLALEVAQIAVSGARDAAANALVPLVDDSTALPSPVLRTWTTRADERVRLAHREAAGQTHPVGENFTVGGYEMRFPSDPMAPDSVARGCRCWLTYAWGVGDKFTIAGV